MSQTVDNKVVKMQFDNQQFEQGVKTSLSTLDKLKKGLHLDGAVEGLKKVESTISNMNFNPLHGSLDKIKLSFNALDVAALTVFQDIVRSAEQAGKRVVSAFTIDPVKSGFQEYETQINAVQTILANTSSKGTTLDQVNTALDELNHYADLTIYNFTEMTRNIGTFTAAGVDLDTSVSAIKGIANLAAVSGSTSQQASTAMYQLSQALAAGTVKLQDWNSVVNAGMGGQVFQDALKETARVHNIAIDDMIEKEGSFRETLSKGWLSSDILTETLSKFTGDLSEAELKNIGYTEEQIDAIMKMGKTANDAATKVKTFTQLKDTLLEAAQSGWTQSWELIIGDFEEAKEFLTGLSDYFSDIIGKSADKRNNLLSGALSSSWSQLTGKVEAAGLSVENFQNELIETAKKHKVRINDMIKEQGSFEKTLKSGWLTSGMVSETIRRMIGDTSGLSDATGDATEKLKDLQDVVNKVINGSFGNGETRVKKLTEAGYDYATVQKMVNEVLKGGKVEIDEMSDSQLKNIGYTDDQIKALRALADEADKTGTPIDELIQNLNKPSGRALLLDSIQNTLKGIEKLTSTVSKAWRDVFPATTSEQLYKLVEQINKFSKSLILSKENLSDVHSACRGLFSILKILSTLVTRGLKLGGKLIGSFLKPAAKNLLELAGIAGDSIYDFAKLGDEGIDKITNKLGKFKDAVTSLTPVRFVIDNVKDGLDLFHQALVKIHEVVGDVSFGSFKDNFSDLENLIGKASNSIQSKGKELSNALKSITLPAGIKPFETMSEGLKKFLDVLANFKMPTIDNLTSGLGKLKTFLSNNNYLTSGVNTVVGCVTYLKNALFYTPDKPSIIDKAIEIVTKAKDTLEKLAKKLNISSDSINDAGKNIITSLKTLGGEIKKALGGLEIGNIDDVINIGKGVATLGVLYQLYTILKKIAGMKTITQSVSSVATSLTKMLNAKAKGLKTDMFKDLGIGVALISASIIALSKVPWKEAKVAVAEVGGIIASLFVIQVAIMGLTKLLGTVGEVKLTGISVNVVAMSAAMILMAKALDVLNGIEISEKDLEQKISAMTALWVLLSLTSVALASSKGGIATGAITVLAFVGALKLLIGVLREYNELNFSEMENGIQGLAAAMSTLTIMLMGIGIAGKGSLKGVALALIAFIASMITVAKMMKWFDGQEIGGGAVLMTVGIMGAITLFIAAINKISTKSLDKAKAMSMSLLSVAAVLVATMAGIKVLGEMKLGDLAKGLIATTAVMAALYVLVKYMSKTQFAPDLVNKGKMLVGFAAAMLALVVSVAVLGVLPTDVAIQGVLAVSALLIAMGGAVALATKYDTKAIGNIIAMAGVIVALVAGIKILETVDLARIGVSALALGGVIVALGLVLTALGAWGSGLSGKAVVGVLAMGAVIVAVAGAIKILDGMELTNMLGTAGILLGVVIVLSSIMALLSNVATNVASTIGLLAMAATVVVLAVSLKQLADVPWQTLLAGAAAIGIMAIALAGASALMSGFAVGGLVMIGVLLSLSVAMVAFGAGSKWFAEGLQLAANALPGLSSGLVTLVTSLAGCSDEISTAGKSIVTFLSQVAAGLTVLGVGLVAVSPGAVVFAAALVVLSAAVISASGAIVILGGALTVLGGGLTTVGNGISVLDTVLTTAINHVVAGVTKLADAVIKIGNYVAEGLSKGMTDSTGNVATSALSMATSVISVVCAALGIHSPSTVMKMIGGYIGEGLGIGMDDSKGKVSDSAGGLSDAIMEQLQDTDIYKQLGLDSGESLASGLSGASGSVSEATNGLSDSALDSLGNNDLFKSLGLDSGSSYASGLSEGADNNTSLNSAMDEMLAKTKQNNTSFKKSGEETMTSFVNGVKSGKSSAVGAISIICTAMRNSVRKEYGNFKEAGSYMVQGFANGISSKTYLASAKAREMAKSASDAAKKQLDEHSPSKVFYGIGAYAGQGFVNALDYYSKASYNAGAGVADSAREGLNKSASKIVGLMANEDWQPTIRPVVDLSDAKAGLSELGRIMPTGQSIGVSANIDAVSGMMAQRQNGVNNDDVVNAISELGDKLDGISGDSYVINGVTYDDGSNITNTVKALTREIRVRRRM